MHQVSISKESKKVHRLNDVLQTLCEHAPQLEQKYPVQLLGVFGSVARGDNTSESDIDLLANFKPTMGLNDLLDLCDELEQLFTCKIDIVTPQQITARYWLHISPEVVYLKNTAS